VHSAVEASSAKRRKTQGDRGGVTPTAELPSALVSMAASATPPLHARPAAPPASAARTDTKVCATTNTQAHVRKTFASDCKERETQHEVAPLVALGGVRTAATATMHMRAHMLPTASYTPTASGTQADPRAMLPTSVSAPEHAVGTDALTRAHTHEHTPRSATADTQKRAMSAFATSKEISRSMPYETSSVDARASIERGGGGGRAKHADTEVRVAESATDGGGGRGGRGGGGGVEVGTTLDGMDEEGEGGWEGEGAEGESEGCFTRMLQRLEQFKITHGHVHPRKVRIRMCI